MFFVRHICAKSVNLYYYINHICSISLSDKHLAIMLFISVIEYNIYSIEISKLYICSELWVCMYNKRDNIDKLISSISLSWSTEIKYQISVCCLAWIKHIAMILQQKVVGVGFTNYLFLKEAYTHKYKSYRYNCEIFMACSWW